MSRVNPLPWLKRFHLAHNVRETIRPREYFHAHDGIEFLYIHEGSGQLVLNDRYYRIEPPMLMFYQPFQEHFLHMDFPYARTVLKVRLQDSDRFARLFPTLHQFVATLAEQKLNDQVFRLDERQDADLRSLFGLFHETLKLMPEPERTEHFYGYWAQFLSYFKTRIYIQSVPTEQALPARSTRHIEKIMKWVEEHFIEEFQLNKLAEEVHLSPSYVSRLFRKTTGSTIMEYIGKRRLEEACLLLRTSTLPVSEIAQTSGFSDAAYFCRSFKKKYGATPLQYRSTSG